jgi:hypothetical protein
VSGRASAINVPFGGPAGARAGLARKAGLHSPPGTAYEHANLRTALAVGVMLFNDGGAGPRHAKHIE